MDLVIKYFITNLAVLIKKMYKIQSKKEELVFTLHSDLNRHKSLLRGLREDYTITYPDGHKEIVEFIEINDIDKKHINIIK